MATKNSKTSESKEAENVISSGSQQGTAVSDVVQGITSVSNGVIGTGTVKRKAVTPKPKEEPVQEKLAIHSTKNVSWPGVGKVQKGYNIVTKEQAEKWLSRSHVRAATPEEVAQEFGQ